MQENQTKEKIGQYYHDMKEVISDALQTSFAEKYNSEEENAFAANIKQQLSEMNDLFRAEIDELEQITEWDKFCISFFGETNAGKSTIIESLRIIYNEESRLQKILQNQENLNEAISDNIQAYKILMEQTEKLKEMVSSHKKSVSIKTYIISIILTIIAVSTVFLSGTFDWLCQLLG